MIFSKKLFIFKVKVLKEVRFSESLLILLEIRFVWNNGGQKPRGGTLGISGWGCAAGTL